MAYSIDDKASSRRSALSFFPPLEDSSGRPTSVDGHQVVKKLGELETKVTQIHAMRQQAGSGQNDYAQGLESLAKCRSTINKIVSSSDLQATKDTDKNADEQPEKHFPHSFGL